MRRLYLSFVVSSLALVSGEPDFGTPREVQIQQGVVRGYKEPGKSYYGFYGIPYATAPTGPHKFKGPLPPPSWIETLNAVEKNIACPQSPFINHIIPKSTTLIEQENCLVANIYVPDTEEKNLPVVIYIHGGAFEVGYANMLTHDSLLKSGKVIEVTFNYRLGPHGFLCLGTEDIPGNAGMKDQVAALRWVKRNIEKFGGNSRDITLAGYSAGSASVELLILSKSSRGLFQKAILESASAVGVWATQVDPIANAKNYAQALNFKDVNNILALESFYKNISLKVLQVDPFMDRTDSTFVFVPCVEKISSDDAFLNEAPIDIIKSNDFNHVPLLYGFGNMEGIYRLPFFEQWKDKMNEDFSNFLPADLGFKDENEKKEVIEDIKEFYFHNKPVDMATLINFVDYFTDVLFAYPVLRSVRLHLEAGNDAIYLYEYSYVDENRPLPYNIYGADHCAQSLAISTSIFVDDSAKVSESYADIKEMLTKLWLNFIVSGKPVLEECDDFPEGWPATSLENPTYMKLDVLPELRSGLLKKRVEFWNRIYDQHYRRPTAPIDLATTHTEL